MSTARLSMALNSLGCEVDLLAPANHPARVTGVFRRHFTYQPLWPLRNLKHALLESHADVIIAADEIALDQLQELSAGDTPFARSLRETMARSFGNLAALEAARSRLAFLDLAQAEGVATPQTLKLNSESDVLPAIERFGLPLVLKSDGSAGGQGVRVVQTAEQALSAWHALHKPPSFLRVIKRALIDKEWMHVRTWARREHREVTAQTFVSGVERTGMAVASGGRMLASVSLEVVENMFALGSSSVLRIVDDAVMEQAMAKMIARLGWSGFCGFDFILDPETGTPLLIEMNARPTQIAYMPLGPGKDLVAAYLRDVLHHDVPDRPTVTQNTLIAMFPQELTRDPRSAWFTKAYHDVPWESPALVEAALPKGASVEQQGTEKQGTGNRE